MSGMIVSDVGRIAMVERREMLRGPLKPQYQDQAATDHLQIDADLMPHIANWIFQVDMNMLLLNLTFEAAARLPNVSRTSSDTGSWDQEVNCHGTCNCIY